MTSRRVLYPLSVIALLGFFLFFTAPSIRMYFDSDDLYALYFAWSKPMTQIIRENLTIWKGLFRPFGAFFYKGLYAVVGFHPRPFRIFALGMCLADMALCFWFVRMVSKSERSALLATLLFAFQARMIEVWFRTTVIFDIFCFTFAYLIVGLYIKAREERRDLSVGRVVALLALFVCDLNSKEFAVAVPVFLVAWEVLFNSREWRRFFKSRAALTILLMGALTLIYTYGKLHGAESMTNNPTYTPQYTWARFSETWGEYLHDLFFLQERPAGVVSVSILGGMLALAAAFRSRSLAFAWALLFFGMLPVSFSPARGGYEIYFSWLGWVMYAGCLLVELQDLLTRRNPQVRTALASAVFVAVATGYGIVNYHFLKHEDRPWLYESPDAIRVMTKQIQGMHHRFPRGVRMLFLEDGIGWGEWTPTFIMRVLYDDPTMIVDRLKQRTADKPAGWVQYSSEDHVHYDYVFSFNGQDYLGVPKEVAAIHGIEVRDRQRR
jgi:hypothetical protein